MRTDGEQVHREEEIFRRAIGLPAAGREEYLAMVCGDETVMRKRIERLLDAHANDGFMSGPAVFLSEAPLPLAAPGEQPDDRIGNYRLIEQIGTGGFGTVWKAAQEAPLRRLVALKILRLGMDTEEVVSRFQQEREALALMSHPNIARIFDAGATPAGRPFITMELLESVKITAYCEAKGIAIRGRLALFVQVCRAIQHAHQKGVIHRDLKPSNVLVTEDQGTARVKVIDFGVAKATRAAPGEHSLFTQCGQMIGTPLYMSPEQTGVAGGDADPRADIYSLGVLLYELLTGSTPIHESLLKEKGLDEVRRLIREEDPPRPSQRLRALAGHEHTTTGGCRRPLMLSGDLDWIVMKCLEKDRWRRYETAGALAADLECYLSDQPVSARPPSPFYTLGKTVRRHRTLFSAVAAVLAVLIAGIIVSTALAIRSMKAERAEVQLRREAETHRQEALLRAYEADMSAASLLQTRGETGRVAELVERYFPQPGLPDLRGFEWRYLESHLPGEQAVILKGHDNMVSTVAFSRNGRWLASGDVGGQVHVWDARTWRLLATPLDGESRVVEVSFSHDDRFLAAGNATHLHIWSLPDFRPVRQDSLPSVRPVYSPTRPLLALGIEDNQWRGTQGATWLWAWEEDDKLERVRILPTAGTRIAFSANGEALATGSAEGSVRWWDSGTGKELGAVAQGSTLGLALAGDGSWLVGNPCLRALPPVVWALPTGNRLDGLFDDAHTGVTALAASPVENVLATGSANQRITLWDMATRRERMRLTGHRNEVTALAFSPDGQWLASGSKDETVRLWRIAEPPPRTEVSGLHVSMRMGGVVVSADGTLVAISSAMGPPKIFRAQTLEEIATIKAWCWPLAFSPDGKRLVTLQSGGLLELWETASGRSLGGRWLPARPNSECLSALSPDGGVLGLCGGRDLYFIDTLTGGVLAHAHEHSGLILGSAFSPDGRLHVTGSQDGLAILREVPGGRVVHVLAGHKQDLRGVAFSPDSRLLATGAHDNRIKVWDVSTGREIADLSGHKQVVNFLAFSADGKTLFSAGDEEEVLLWRTGSWRSLGRYPVPYPVCSMALSTQGNLLAVNGYPAMLKVFRTLPQAETGAHAGSLPAVRPWVLTELPPGVRGMPGTIPPRAAETPEVSLDLTAHYNGHLQESWTAVLPGDSCSLAGLNPGVHTLGGLPWDIRGVIQVCSASTEVDSFRSFPTAVENIPVRQAAHRMHFLGAAAWGGTWQHQPEIGRILIRYADGETARYPLVLGQNLFDWFDNTPRFDLPEDGSARVVWQGSNPLSRENNAGLRLFDMVWSNPRHDEPIESLDLVAVDGNPFLVAITIEP